MRVRCAYMRCGKAYCLRPAIASACRRISVSASRHPANDSPRRSRGWRKRWTDSRTASPLDAATIGLAATYNRVVSRPVLRQKLVTLIPGDGIGPEVADATARAVEATGAAIEWERVDAGERALAIHGALIPDDLYALARSDSRGAERADGDAHRRRACEYQRRATEEAGALRQLPSRPHAAWVEDAVLRPQSRSRDFPREHGRSVRRDSSTRWFRAWSRASRSSRRRRRCASPAPRSNGRGARGARRSRRSTKPTS